MKWTLVCWFRSDASGNFGMLLQSAPKMFDDRQAAVEFIGRCKMDPRFDHAELTSATTEVMT